jgi:hypothetical protein
LRRLRCGYFFFDLTQYFLSARNGRLLVADAQIVKRGITFSFGKCAAFNRGDLGPGICLLLVWRRLNAVPTTSQPANDDRPVWSLPCSSEKKTR